MDAIERPRSTASDQRATLFALCTDAGGFVHLDSDGAADGDLPLARAQRRLLFEDPIRSVLFVGGVVIAASEATVVRALRTVLVRPEVGEKAKLSIEEADCALHFGRPGRRNGRDERGRGWHEQ